MVKFVAKNGVRIFETFEEIPYEIRGYEPDLSLSRAQGHCVHRAELDNKPKYKGFLGPMWDGGNFRYETQEVYDLLSM